MIRDFKQSVASFYLALHQSAAGMTPKKPGNKLACLTAGSLVSKSVGFFSIWIQLNALEKGLWLTQA